MAQILLTYDIRKTSETIHTELKNHLIGNYKYSSKIQSDQAKWYDLPNTSLVKNGITSEQASADFPSDKESAGK